MLIENIKLNQFRNYEDKTFYFDKGINVIIGSNGIGKTNILEAIMLLSNTKSFRTSDDKSLIMFENKYCGVEIKTNEDVLRAVINEEGKSFYVNEVLKRRASEVIGKINAIIFKPGDIELFAQSPKSRRKELDIELGKISSIYLDALTNYHHLLKEKNILLKERKLDFNLISVINDSLIPTIKVIIAERENFIKNINSYISNIYKEISGEESNIKIIYKKCSEVDSVDINIDIARERDLIYCHSTFGPHIEDYKFTINDKDMEDYASQGQKRMVIIALKLSIAKYIQEKFNQEVIILLDDVLSELDIDKSEKLLNMLPTNQIIITTTDINNIKINREYKLINLKEEKNG